jgi:hypothetical protein
VARLDDFSISDADALLKLIYSNPSGRIIIVGGQAVNFWASRYAPDEPELLAYRPFTSGDLDLLGSIGDAYRLGLETNTEVERPRRGAASPIVANVRINAAGVVRSVQFLKSLRGVTNCEIDDNAVQFGVGDTNIYVADPITMLKAKLHNLVELDQHGRNDRNHVDILRLCVRLFLERQLTTADEGEAAARQCLRNLQRILELSRSAVTRRSEQFDWKALIPVDSLKRVRSPRLKNFRDQQLERWLKGNRMVQGSARI